MEKGTKKITESAFRSVRLYILSEASALVGKNWDGHYCRYNLFMYLNGGAASLFTKSEHNFWQAQQISFLMQGIEIL